MSQLQDQVSKKSKLDLIMEAMDPESAAGLKEDLLKDEIPSSVIAKALNSMGYSIGETALRRSRNILRGIAEPPQ